MNITQDQQVIREDYRAEQEALRELQVSAKAGFIAARDEGDLEGLRHWSEQLKVGVEKFEVFRNALHPLEQFVAKYNICELGPHQVKLVLPARVSRIQFLEDAQELSQLYRGQNAGWPTQLQLWQKDAEYTAVSPTPALLMIDGCVDDSWSNTRRKQETYLSGKGLKMPTLCDLAIAQVGYFVASGKDLLCG